MHHDLEGMHVLEWACSSHAFPKKYPKGEHVTLFIHLHSSTESKLMMTQFEKDCEIQLTACTTSRHVESEL